MANICKACISFVKYHLALQFCPRWEMFFVMEAKLDSIAGRIRQGMSLRRIYASELSRHLDVSRAAVSQWLKGASEPSSAKLRAIADALELNLEWLGQGTGPMARAEKRIIVADGVKIDPRDLPDDLKSLLGTKGRREFWRIASDRMMGAGYRPGDYALVDLSLHPKARDIVLATHNKIPIFRLYLPPYLYGAAIGGQQPDPLVVDDAVCRIIGVVVSRHSSS
jgi:transcriptional regulator with XRE-family HTH domain